MCFTGITAFCSQLTFINWLQNHLLTCPFKYLTGIDCPGCGFQRAVIALLQGDLSKSFHIYPPAIPLLIVFAYGILDAIFKLDDKNGTVKKLCFIVAGSIVLISYSVKVAGSFEHYKAASAAATAIR